MLIFHQKRPGEPFEIIHNNKKSEDLPQHYLKYQVYFEYSCMISDAL